MHILDLSSVESENGLRAWFPPSVIEVNLQAKIIIVSIWAFLSIGIEGNKQWQLIYLDSILLQLKSWYESFYMVWDWGTHLSSICFLSDLWTDIWLSSWGASKPAYKCWMKLCMTTHPYVLTSVAGLASWYFVELMIPNSCKWLPNEYMEIWQIECIIQSTPESNFHLLCILKLRNNISLSLAVISVLVCFPVRKNSCEGMEKDNHPCRCLMSQTGF